MLIGTHRSHVGMELAQDGDARRSDPHQHRSEDDDKQLVGIYDDKKHVQVRSVCGIETRV